MRMKSLQTSARGQPARLDSSAALSARSPALGHHGRQQLLARGPAMLPYLPRRSCTRLLLASRAAPSLSRSRLPALALKAAPPATTRTFISWFKTKPKPSSAQAQDAQPVLTEDNLFHPFSESPFPSIRARGEAIRQRAPCPVCASEHNGVHAHTKAQPKAVAFECPDCGWPTHCSEEHWAADQEHQKYCSRLREANEDEHDLRSGRRMREFELPGAYAWHAPV